MLIQYTISDLDLMFSVVLALNLQTLPCHQTNLEFPQRGFARYTYILLDDLIIGSRCYAQRHILIATQNERVEASYTVLVTVVMKIGRSAWNYLPSQSE